LRKKKKKSDVKESYLIGEVVEASFWAGNPRNDFQLGKSFLYVDRSNGSKDLFKN